MLADDYALVESYMTSYGEAWLIENGYQSYVDFYKTNYEAMTKEGGQVDVKLAELLAAFNAETFAEIVKQYAAAQTELYAFYLW